MAQLSGLTQLYLKISDNLTEEDVRNFRSLLAVDEILGKAKVEKATPLEIFNMLKDNGMIGKGNLGLLVQVLRCLRKGELADEAERLEQEHKKGRQGREIHDTTVMTQESNTQEDARRIPEEDDSAATVTRDGASEDSEPENTEVKEIISAASAEPEPPKDVHGATSELASLHIRELVRLKDEPMKALGPSEPDSSTDAQDAKSRLETLLAELDTPAVMADQEQQCVLYCQIGDLYRAKLYDLQSALQYYQSMLECSKSLSVDKTQAKAHNRLGLTYDMLGKHEEATRSHERVLEICRDAVGEEVDVCVAYKNLASSLTLSGKVSEAKTNYKTALRLARKTSNRIEEIDIHCKLGDLHKEQLKELQASNKHYTKMLELAKDSGRKFWEMVACNRLGHVCGEMQDNEMALEWHQKCLKMSKENGEKRDQIIAYYTVGVLLGKLNEAKSHLDTALQMAQEKGEEYGQMGVYMRMGDMQRDKFNSPRTAVQYYEQYLTLARQLGDRRQEGWAYNRLGWAHFDMRKYETALEWHQKALTTSQEIEDKKDEVTAHTAMGNAHRLLGNIEQATSHFHTALQLAQQTENLRGQMDVDCKMGDLQREQLDSPRTAIQYYEQQLALARQLGDRRQEGVAYNRLGWTHADMSEYEAALELYQKHLKISQESEDKKEEVTALVAVGNAYRLLGNLEQATFHFDTALQLAQQTENLHGQMDVYCKMGDLQRVQLDSPRTAIQHYEQHLALARQLEDRNKEGTAYNRLGRAHYAMEEYENALKWDKKDLEIRQETVERSNLLIPHKNIGASYMALGKLDQARSHYQSALTIAMETGNKQEQMDIYLGLGDLHRKQLHEPRQSHKYYTEMLALAKDLGRKDKERQAYNRLGVACWDMQDNEAALEWHHKDLKMSEEDGDKTEQISAHQNIAGPYKALGKLDQARSHYQSALTIATETGNKQEQKNITEALRKLDQASSQSRSAMAIAKKSGNEQEQRKNSKKRTGRKNCHVS